MDSKEFNQNVARTETDTLLTLDVRPFGERQAEAIDSYLHDVGMAVQMNVFRHTKPIVLLCDAEVVLLATTTTWLAGVHRQGVAVEIQRAPAQ
jgi:hypothetical protein